MYKDKLWLNQSLEFYEIIISCQDQDIKNKLACQHLNSCSYLIRLRYGSK